MDYLENTFNFTLPTELNLYYCGRRIKTTNHEYGPTMQRHFLIVYVKEGSATILSETPHIRINSGAVFFMFPNHRFHYKVDPDTKWTILWIGVYGSLVENYVKLLDLSPENPVFYPQSPDKIEDVLTRIFETSKIENLSSKIKCISLVQSFFSKLFENFSEKKIKNSHINEAVHFMRLNYDVGISVNDVATKINIDRSYFSRIFRDEFSVTPGKWLNDFRLTKACELLKESDLTIGEIASSVGIFDALYFSRLFKKSFGISPSTYRKQNQGEAKGFYSE